MIDKIKKTKEQNWIERTEIEGGFVALNQTIAGNWKIFNEV
jgi:hypothetical protein